MKTTEIKRIFALMLALILVLSAFACNGGGSKKDGMTTSEPNTPAPTEAPTPEPTPEPTSEPTPEPTATPVPTPAPGEHENFDRATMTYSDEYVSFRVPDEVPCVFDYTADMQAVYAYDLYMMFTPSAAASMPNVGYYYKLGTDPDDANSYVNMSEQELQALFKSTYEAMFHAEVIVRTVSYDTFSGSNYKGVIYEYDVEYSGAVINQYLWSAFRDDGALICIAYTWSPDVPMDVHTSAASITIK